MRKIVQKYDSKWLNVYDIVREGKNNYTFVSRRKFKDINSCDDFGNAVKALPYFIRDNKVYVVFSDEFRNVANRRILNLPAGCVDKGENPYNSMVREIREEIGGETKKMQSVVPMSYTSLGITDEKIEMFFAEVELKYEQHLDDGEDISVFVCEADRLLEVLKTKELDLGSYMLCLIFIERYANYMKNPKKANNFSDFFEFITNN